MILKLWSQREAEEDWSKHCREVADQRSLRKQIPGIRVRISQVKKGGFQIYVGGYGPYRRICDEIAAKGYEGFSLVASQKTVLKD